MGRQEGFMNRLIAKIKILDGSDQTAQIQLLDKHLQILFFTLKNSEFFFGGISTEKPVFTILETDEEQLFYILKI